MQSNSHSIWSVLIVFLPVLALYVLPALIGFKRGVSTRVLLLFVNLFTGWTVLMWIVCLLWSVTGATKAQDAFYRAQVR